MDYLLVEKRLCVLHVELLRKLGMVIIDSLELDFVNIEVFGYCHSLKFCQNESLEIEGSKSPIRKNQRL